MTLHLCDTQWPNSGLFLQNALVEYIGVYSDTNKTPVHVFPQSKIFFPIAFLQKIRGVYDRTNTCLHNTVGVDIWETHTVFVYRQRMCDSTQVLYLNHFKLFVIATVSMYVHNVLWRQVSMTSQIPGTWRSKQKNLLNGSQLCLL